MNYEVDENIAKWKLGECGAFGLRGKMPLASGKFVLGRSLRLTAFHVKWIHSDGNYCEIHTDERTFIVKLSLVKLIKILERFQFCESSSEYIDSIT